MPAATQLASQRVCNAETSLFPPHSVPPGSLRRKRISSCAVGKRAGRYRCQRRSISRNTSQPLFEVWRTDPRLHVRSDLPGSSTGTIFASVPALIFIRGHVHLLLASFEMRLCTGEVNRTSRIATEPLRTQCLTGNTAVPPAGTHGRSPAEGLAVPTPSPSALTAPGVSGCFGGVCGYP